MFQGSVFFTTTEESTGNTLRVSDGDTITAIYEDSTLPPPFEPTDDLDITGTAFIGEEAPEPEPNVIEEILSQIQDILASILGLDTRVTGLEEKDMVLMEKDTELEDRDAEFEDRILQLEEKIDSLLASEIDEDDYEDEDEEEDD